MVARKGRRGEWVEGKSDRRKGEEESGGEGREREGEFPSTSPGVAPSTVGRAQPSHINH